VDDAGAEHLIPIGLPSCDDLVRAALEEDRARDDITTALLGDRADGAARGVFLAEAPLVVAGVPVAVRVFGQLDPRAEGDQHVAEGSWAEPDQAVATVRASARVLLAGERVALNFLQRLSGIATATRRAVDAVRGTGAEITDTRKTTPGLRALEKYAVRAGGGTNHRGSLADAVLFKDNHWVLMGGAPSGAARLEDVLSRVPVGVAVVVEVESDAQLDEALAAGVKRVLVDNQPPERVAEWVRRCGPGVAVEASGGITPERALAYARAGARFISIGSLTHSVRAAALRFEIAYL
jgi:nicotinate-nucleotide pyrophosphorylase (carboxylating)